jgi:hypothetical protein
MPNWHSILYELKQTGSQFDAIRKKYLNKMYKLTKRNVICYYSGWLQKNGIDGIGINDFDKNGFMTVINGLNKELGLDLILHTPGGDTAATESIIDYLYQSFKNDIRCFVPQMAMSGGTMIACSAKEIWMGNHSSLGPIDPQYGNLPAHALIEEFKRAVVDISTNPAMIPVWQPIIAKYRPTLIGECEKVIEWSNQIVKECLTRNMLNDDPWKKDKLRTIMVELADHSINLAHNRHLSPEKCLSIGLNIKKLEDDQKLQEAVLSIHHAFIHTLGATVAFKIIENHKGIAFVQQAQLMIVPQNQPVKNDLDEQQKSIL